MNVPDSKTHIKLAVTLGDPRGIGPEVMTRAARDLLTERNDTDLVVLGADQHRDRLDFGVEFIGVGPFEGSLRSAGEISSRSIERGVQLARDGMVSGVVTGPIHKPALREACVLHPGQTEFLQSLTGAARVGMLMHALTTRLGGPLRVLLLTRHMPLREVPGSLTARLIEEQVILLDHSLRVQWHIPAPRIAFCSLNPHASDDGLFGDEEARVLSPAASRLRDAGIDITDPLPADTVFLSMVKGLADAIVVPYHDVGMAVFKTLAFGHGVNVTLGLPFVRTSPDHGTAFALVGSDQADSSSALEALRLARSLAGLPDSARATSL